MFGLIHYGKLEHNSYYNINRVGFRDGDVIIASTNDGDIVGRISIGVKDVYLEGELTKVGYVFDIQFLDLKQLR